jgi:hypothetical protein
LVGRLHTSVFSTYEGEAAARTCARTAGKNALLSKVVSRGEPEIDMLASISRRSVRGSGEIDMLALPRTRLGPRTRQSRRRGAALRARRGCFGPITCGIRKFVPPGPSVHLHAGAGAFGFGTTVERSPTVVEDEAAKARVHVRWRAIKALRAVVLTHAEPHKHLVLVVVVPRLELSLCSRLDRSRPGPPASWP